MRQAKSTLLIHIAGPSLPPPGDTPKDTLNLPGHERLLAWQPFIREQILAIGQQLASKGEQLLVITNKGNPLAQEAKNADLPALELAGLSTLPNRFRIWKWLRRQSFLQIIAIDEESLPFTMKLAKTRKDACKTCGLFYLPARKNLKRLSQLDACLYASFTVLESLPESVTSPIFCLPGIEIPQPESESALNKSEGNFVFGMAESLCNASGALTVARAMAAIWQIAELPPWEVRMFGSGSRFNLVLEEAEKLGVNSRLALLSEQPLQSVAPLCDAWLAPGYSPLENPQTLWAGICANLPTISTETSLHQWWLPANEAITLPIAPENPQALAAAMLEILKYPEKREQLIRNSQKWKKEISLMAMCDRLHNILEENESEPVAVKKDSED